jgi:hypothetical protein
MKFFKLPMVMAAAVVSAAVVMPFVALPEKETTGSFALEVSMASTRAGFAQVFYRDAAGQLSEAASSRTPVAPGSVPRPCRLPLPTGVHDGLRFDPIDGAGTVVIESVRIVTRTGRLVRNLPLADLTAGQQIATVPGLGGDLSGRHIAAATQYRLTGNTTAFDIHANGPGVIVLSETFWPGDFRAEVNGRKAPVLRLNHAFKGVAVDAAGDYHVIFRYVPRNFPRHLLLSALGAILGALSLVLALRARRVA